jgi:hypothetical protein
MGKYLALRIVEGALTYTEIFSQTRFAKYKTEVDSTLTSGGHANLIVTV